MQIFQGNVWLLLFQWDFLRFYDCKGLRPVQQVSGEVVFQEEPLATDPSRGTC